MAVATTRLGNRFGFPKPEVVARYRESGAEFWSTGACGALRFHFQADGAVAVESARRENRRIWRWPAAADCP
jgi:competence protein ComEC